MLGLAAAGFLSTGFLSMEHEMVVTIIIVLAVGLLLMSFETAEEFRNPVIRNVPIYPTNSTSSTQPITHRSLTAKEVLEILASVKEPTEYSKG
jgi:hypothetical protein